jgi:predicted nucleic acid-binding protein
MSEQLPRPESGLLDTSVVIGLARVTDPDELPAQPLISTVTLADLSVGPLVARDDTTRAARSTSANGFLNRARKLNSCRGHRKIAVLRRFVPLLRMSLRHCRSL